MLQAERGKVEQGSKVMTLDDLEDLLARVRPNKKVVLCHGVFDLLHIGHIRHFEQAREFGDLLVVTVTPDRFVNKGTNRPAFTENLRAEAIAALHHVDYVVVNQWPTAIKTIELLKPDFYVKGKEYSEPDNDLTGKIVDERRAVEQSGGKLVFTDDITYSSSALINRYLPIFSDEVNEYLTVFKERHSFDEIAFYLKSAQKLKVLVVGETIIDEYCYCEVIGKSAKEPILAAKSISSEKFLGGILAVANHVANFCEEVSLLSLLGTEASQEQFIREHIRDNIDLAFVYKSNAPTIVKRRFVEQYSSQKLFAVYEMNDEVLSEEEDRTFCVKLEEVLPKYDVVIVVDYGHSLLTQTAIDILNKLASYLVVNTQSNAGNRGFNTISKYSRADYICLAQHELMLDTRNRWGTPREMMKDLLARIECPKMTLTRGKLGSLTYSAEEGFCEVPAFDQQVVDRMGAGDAVISIASLCAAQGAPIEIIGFVGNVVGSQAVATLGHRSSIERVRLLKHIDSILK